MLKLYHTLGVIEAGCDEAGRGCLAGPVFAAAVILPADFDNELLNDSKQLTERQRYALRDVVEREAAAWAVAECSAAEIDNWNILRCSIIAMQRALDKLRIRPEHIIVDGNRWKPYHWDGEVVAADTIVKGDATFMSIAAASVLAKTYRDDRMKALAQEFPQYGWDKNMGYPARSHREAIRQYGPSPYHRMTFRLLPEEQLMLDF
ncbi:MAG: ribonuclease HII [Bacteroidaceae bacterium]|nr:ribonuclease HII [Bacteroidaceae bacterium]